MKLKVIVRIALLAVLLAGTVWFQRQTTPEAVEQIFSTFGFELDGGGRLNLQPSNRALKPGEYRQSLCPSRLVRIAYLAGDPKSSNLTSPSSSSLQASSSVPSVTQAAGTAPPRLSSFSLEDRQSGLRSKWVSVAQTPIPSGPTDEINYMAVEKWLGQHCQFIAGHFRSGGNESESQSSTPGSDLGPTLDRIRFETVSGSRLELVRLGDFVFQVDPMNTLKWPGFEAADELGRFQSEDLAQAIDELRAICAN